MTDTDDTPTERSIADGQAELPTTEWPAVSRAEPGCRTCPVCGEAIARAHDYPHDHPAREMTQAARYRSHRRVHYRAGWAAGMLDWDPDAETPDHWPMTVREEAPPGADPYLRETWANDDDGPVEYDWQVTFYDEYIETVTVTAPTRSEARWQAEEQRTYHGEYMDTIHTDTDKLRRADT